MDEVVGEEESKQSEDTGEGSSQSPFVSFDAVANLSPLERAMQKKLEEMDRKKQKEEEKAKQREEEAARKAAAIASRAEKEESEASRKAREGAVAWKREKELAKRKADAEEAKGWMKRAKKEPKTTEFAGGFLLNEKVEAVVDVRVKGKVVVARGTSGTILGPAEIDPKGKLNVQFPSATLVILASEIKRPGGLPGGAEKARQVDTAKINQWLKEKAQNEKFPPGQQYATLHTLTG